MGVYGLLVFILRWIDAIPCSIVILPTDTCSCLSATKDTTLYLLCWWSSASLLRRAIHTFSLYFVSPSLSCVPSWSIQSIYQYSPRILPWNIRLLWLGFVSLRFYQSYLVDLSSPYDHCGWSRGYFERLRKIHYNDIIMGAMVSPRWIPRINGQ